MTQHTTQDSQSELDKLLHSSFAQLHFHNYHENWTELLGEKWIEECKKETKQAIEAYVTTRVKEALEHSVSNIKEEIKASQENLDYQRNKTKNAKLANEWHCTIMGEQWCLRALEKQLKAITTTTNGKET